MLKCRINTAKGDSPSHTEPFRRLTCFLYTISTFFHFNAIRTLFEQKFNYRDCWISFFLVTQENAKRFCRILMAQMA